MVVHGVAIEGKVAQGGGTGGGGAKEGDDPCVEDLNHLETKSEKRDTGVGMARAREGEGGEGAYVSE